MTKCITNPSSHFSPRASLATIGLKMKELDFFGPVRWLVKIDQKTVKYSPSEKLYDGFIAMLAGTHGMVEINTRLRADPALQKAFGRTACAEQSVVQQTLDACTDENVRQMQQALDHISQQHSGAYRHDYRSSYQISAVSSLGQI